ncbi:unnamed protein product [Owenia fusiformis]|uniref:RAP domain-containing protein n=1 Tax=Owenia fusiformis TaxID=6347 RepID=A0A8S4N1I7_OWEFU|nr:unnamed protein product [Owenia fusiformis]
MSGQRCLQRSTRIFKGLCQARDSCSILPPNIKLHISTTPNQSRILSKSIVFCQDGVEIREIPILVRRTDKYDFPVINYMGTGSVDDIQKISEHDNFFKERLQACRSATQVFKMLEIPSDQVTACSAAFALERLCQLQNATYEDIDSFVTTAVLNELCDTVVKDIHSLKNVELINLVKCHLKSGNFSEIHSTLIDEETEKRLGDKMFGITEVCSLIDTLMTHPKGDKEIADNALIHIGNRTKEIDETNIADVYKALSKVSPLKKYMSKLLVKQLLLCWWKISPKDMTSIVSNLTQMKYCAGSELVMVGKWVLLNIHNIKQNEMTYFVAAYRHFKMGNANFMRALERYIPAKITSLDSTLIALTMDYCKECRYVSPKIFNCISSHFVQYSHRFSVDQMAMLLYPYGYLNYLPPNANELFQKIEERLNGEFNQFSPESIVELLCSFAFSGRYAINFVRQVFTPHFVAQLHRISDKKTRLHAFRSLDLFQSAVLLEAHKVRLPILVLDATKKLPYLEASYYQNCCREIAADLRKLLGEDNFAWWSFVNKARQHIDFEIKLDNNKYPMHKTTPSEQIDQKIAVIVQVPDYYCVNSKELLGEHAMKLRHLKKLGYKVMEISMVDYKGASDQEQMLIDVLHGHVNIPTHRSRTGLSDDT